MPKIQDQSTLNVRDFQTSRVIAGRSSNGGSPLAASHSLRQRLSVNENIRVSVGPDGLIMPS